MTSGVCNLFVMTAPRPSRAASSRPATGRRIASALSFVAIVGGVALLLLAALGDSSELVTVLAGVALVCAGGLASVLLSPSVSVVDGNGDPRAPRAA